MVEVAAGNLVELIASLAILGLTVNTFFYCLLFKFWKELTLFDKPIRDNAVFVNHEHSVSFYLTLTGWCTVVSVIFPLYFSQIYEEFETISAGPTILSLLVVYHFVMIMWLFSSYILWRSSYRLAYFFLVVALLIAGADIGLILGRLPDQSWVHYLSLLLLVPVFFGFSATNSAKVFRTEIYSTENSKNISNLEQQQSQQQQQQFYPLPQTPPTFSSFPSSINSQLVIQTHQQR